jgi:hypothetical protein
VLEGFQKVSGQNNSMLQTIAIQMGESKLEETMSLLFVELNSLHHDRQFLRFSHPVIAKV